MRCVTGWEAMRAQGFPTHLVDCPMLTGHKYYELVGNAFNAYMLTAVLIAMVETVPWLELVQFPASISTPMPSCAEAKKDAVEDLVLVSASETGSLSDTESSGDSD